MSTIDCRRREQCRRTTSMKNYIKSTDDDRRSYDRVPRRERRVHTGLGNEWQTPRCYTKHEELTKRRSITESEHSSNDNEFLWTIARKFLTQKQRF